MEELLGVAERPHASSNYFSPTDVAPSNYQIAINRNLIFQNKNLNAQNDGYRGFMTISEIVLVARSVFARDKRKRREARTKLIKGVRGGIGGSMLPSDGRMY